MYKGNTDRKMTTNGIHKDWETLPPIKDPATLMENADSFPRITEEEMRKPQVCIANMKPSGLVRCQHSDQITDEEYKQTLDISGDVMDPDVLDNWENVPCSKMLEAQRWEQDTANYYQKIKDRQLLEKEETAQYFRKLAEQDASKKV